MSVGCLVTCLEIGMLAITRPVPLLLLSALLLLGASLSASQQITIPKGDLAGPTPFGTMRVCLCMCILA